MNQIGNTSFPVPDSPVIKTGACERAIFLKRCVIAESVQNANEQFVF
jgi:hypothetical protein